MDFITQHWKAILGVVIVLGFFLAMAVGLASAVPTSAAIKAWSMQESIFYGCLVIAVATLLK